MFQQEMPVSLQNPRLLRPFQNLVTTYARPQYNEIDPTILIAITFPLLFGAMFGDVGHGLTWHAGRALIQPESACAKQHGRVWAG